MPEFDTELQLELPLNKKAHHFIKKICPHTIHFSLSSQDLSTIRKITHILNQQDKNSPFYIEQPRASELFAMVALKEVYTKFISYYSKKHPEFSLEQLDREIAQSLDVTEQSQAMKQFLSNFGESSAIRIDKNIMVFFITNTLLIKNPFFSKYLHFIDISELQKLPAYKKIQKIIESFYQKAPKLKSGKDLLSTMKEPAQRYPHSLEDQLRFVWDNWKEYLGDSIDLVARVLDLFKEEKKWGMLGTGESHIFRSGTDWDEPEHFSPDREWMPSLILIAKNIFVWLHQLSKKYKRDINTLDAIPQEELRSLARQGFTGLWLIGIWERSTASRRIKHLCGNFDAIASAYSVTRYQVAQSLGGDAAMEILAKKAFSYGIRMGCDMVPNHMGIDSDWVYDHPDWFIQTPHCPFPAYSYTGENLSTHPDVEIYIEDGYYNRTDAAVVFKYIDHRDGRTRYIYHGNDGTSFPWNDTAQLNYLIPNVRQAVIEQILSISRGFPIIRFDAAMTLSKKHFQRLWFPEPGSGGDIPSRAEFGMTRDEFNHYMPVEFWREVVDIVAEKAHDTLLLAEAFWLMEGYFVRTLGMHRVYNSAFMNMIKNEQNSNYRQSIKNVLDFDPQILKRFVNFMSNPDEETAVAQFGTDDKYFGSCVMMCTIPGLPMFAHGQIQGYHERYGMEFYKPNWNEEENRELISRHEREIFPLLRNREMFCDVENFYLFDFMLENGNTNENVFAYTNENNERRSLFIFHNTYARTKGWVRWTYFCPKNQNGNKKWLQKNFAEIMNIPDENNMFVIYKDIIKNVEFIKNAHEVALYGMYQELEAFKYAVYSDFIVVTDDEDESYKKLAHYLQGGGTNNIEKERKRVMHTELYERFDDLISEETFKDVFSLQDDNSKLKKIIKKVSSFLEVMPDKNSDGLDVTVLKKLYAEDILRMILIFKEKFSLTHDQFYTLFIWMLIRRIGLIYDNQDYCKHSRKFIEEFNFDEMISDRLNRFTNSEFGNFMIKLIKILLDQQDIWKELEKADCKEFMTKIFDMEEVRDLLECNEFEEIMWFNKESFDEFVIMLEVTQTISLATTLDDSINNDAMTEKLQDCFLRIRKAYAFSEFKVDQFLDGLA